MTGLTGNNAITGAGYRKNQPPYEIDQSLRFEDGDTPYLSWTPGSAGNRKTWTWSGWIKHSTVGSDYWENVFGAKTDANNYAYIVFEADVLRFFNYVSSSANGSTSTSAPKYRDPAAWRHVVIAWDTTQATDTNRLKIYINGEQLTLPATVSYPTLNHDGIINNNTPHYIGGQINGEFDGYLAEMHFIDGQALTPASFGDTLASTNQWVPIEYVGSYGTNGFYQKYSATELANSFTDSAEGHVVTANGNVHTDTSVKKIGTASAQFDGTGDYLRVNSSSDFEVAASNSDSYTLECWVKLDLHDGQETFMSLSDSGATLWRFRNYHGNGVSFQVYNSGSLIVDVSGAEIADTDWHHVALVKVGNGSDSTYTLYKDGTSIGTSTDSSEFTVGGGLDIGCSNTAGDPLQGYMDEIRISNTARYTGNFTPSTSAFTNDANTMLLLHCDGSDSGTTFTDSSTRPRHTITANGNVANSRAQEKIGTSSIYFDGSGDYLSCADSSDWDFLSASGYTAEAWYKPTTHAGTDFIIGQSVDGNNYWMLGHEDGAGLRFESYSGGGLVLNITGGEITDTNWHHIAVVRDSNDVEIFKDGTSVATGTTSSTATFAGQLRIGEGAAHGAMDGYLDEIRLSNTARYTSSFTPSTTAFTADANTVLLIHSDWDGGLGADSSGNENDFSVTNLVATDQVLDSPTNNFATLNPLAVSKYAITSMGEGNLYYAGGSSYTSSIGSIAPTSGKWYTEVYVNANNGTNGNNSWLGVTRTDYPGQAWWDTPFNRTGSVGLQGNGQAYKDGSTTSSDSSGDFDSGDIVGILMNLDDGEIKFKVNNSDFSYTTSITVDGVWTPCVQSYSTGNNVTFNFGQDSSFAGNKTAQGNGGTGEDFYYTPPTGFKALNTDNLDSPAIALPGDYFNTVLYAGNGGTQSVTGAGFSPDFVWIKNRTDAVNHGLFDTIRGVKNSLQSNTTTEARTAAGATEDLYAFGSDGFSVGVGGGAYINCNESSKNYASWNWKAGGTASTNEEGSIDSSVSANTTAGFSIVNWNGTEASATIGHGLSQAPELIIVKDVDTAGRNWPTNIENITGTANQYLFLNTTAEQATSAAYWGGTPGASVFTVGDSANTNDDASMIAYCFHSVEGYSKVGSYTGNGNNDGTFVYTGFRPMWVMAKCADGSGSWLMTDSVRFPYNVTDDPLFANENSAETNSSTYAIDILSNGFKCRGVNNDTNNSSDNVYIYLAFAESPFKTSNAR